MGVINPITDRGVLEKMKEYLRERNTRNYLIFRVGLNLGLSVQELLNLRVEELINLETYDSRNCRVQISKSLKYEISRYIGERKSGYLFVSTKGAPVSRFQLYVVLQSAAKAAGYDEAIGAITLRKTFAYWAYRDKEVSLPLLSDYLHHNTVEYTLKYIGINESIVPEENLIAMDL